MNYSFVFGTATTENGQQKTSPAAFGRLPKSCRNVINIHNQVRLGMKSDHRFEVGTDDQLTASRRLYLFYRVIRVNFL